MSDSQFDFDQVVIGSGFGGSCSALRLSEKGARVLVLEKGKRWADKDFPKTNWNVFKSLWAPWLGCKGTYQMTVTKKVVALHGSGVGGGSLVYGNVHLIPPDKCFETSEWTNSRNNWKDTLLPFYGLAQRMIGVAHNEYMTYTDQVLKTVAEKMGRGDTYKLVNTGILMPQDGKLGEDRGDPFFQGEGPQRNSCEFCAGCMVGCRYNAKNTLVKNYLHFAERNGVEVRAESKLLRIEPLTNKQGVRDGSAGYELTVKDMSNPWFGKNYTIRTRGVVMSAGVLGSIPLLLKMKEEACTLPNISPLLGQKVRTNSEALLMATINKKDEQGKAIEACDGPAIGAIFAADDETNIEVCRYSRGSGAVMSSVVPVPLTEGGTALPRGIKLLANMIKNPLATLRLLNPFGKASNMIVFLVMQTKEAYVHIILKRPWYKLFRVDWGVVQRPGDDPLTTFFPIAHKVAKMFVEETGGDAANVIPEVIADTPMTAHMMGGAPIGESAGTGVVDQSGEVFGYQGLRVLDGSVIPGNLGVNPSLTILALTEHAMSKVPIIDAERAAKIKPIMFDKPLTGLVSANQGEGNLHAGVVATAEPEADSTPA